MSIKQLDFKRDLVVGTNIPNRVRKLLGHEIKRGQNRILQYIHHSIWKVGSIVKLALDQTHPLRSL